MTRPVVLRWLVILAAIIIAVTGYFLYLRWQPSELEASIRNDLILRKQIGESANVSVVKHFKLFDAASNRLDCVTVCIKDESGYYLARLRRMGQDPRDTGASWSTVKDFWRSYQRRPSSTEIEKYLAYDEEYLQRMSGEGWLPRPAEMEDFRTRMVSIRISAAIEDFDPNEGIDPARLASLVVRDEGVSGRLRFGQFTIAPFHNSRWFPAADGRQVASDYIDLLESQLERCRDEERRRELEADLDTLRTVANHLETIEENAGTFYFLAADENRLAPK